MGWDQDVFALARIFVRFECWNPRFRLILNRWWGSVCYAGYNNCDRSAWLGLLTVINLILSREGKSSCQVYFCVFSLPKNLLYTWKLISSSKLPAVTESSLPAKGQKREKKKILNKINFSVLFLIAKVSQLITPFEFSSTLESGRLELEDNRANAGDL